MAADGAGAGEPRSSLERLLTDKIPARLLALELGELVHPGGGLVAATAAPVLEYILGAANDQYVTGAREVLVTAATGAQQDLAALPDYLARSAERLALATDATRAALDTLDRAKLTALARVLAYGLQDDAQLEMAHMYLRALRTLEAPHVRVLGHLVDLLPGYIEDEDLPEHFPGLVPGLAPVLEVLRREALAVGPSSGGALTDETGNRWSATSFGQQTHAWLLETN